jgi:hypothetical protein
VRLYLGAAALVSLVLGGAWLLLALTVGHSSVSADAFMKSAACVRHDPALAIDRTDAARYRASGLQTLGIRWNGVRAVALFDDSLSAGSVTKKEAEISSAMRRGGDSSAVIADRLQYQDNVALFYVNGSPAQASEAAIGRCVYLVHYNRVASFFGLYFSPHAERPFLPGAYREDDRG